MSGFEIAGIVLGAFPLAISALAYYQTDVAPLLVDDKTIEHLLGNPVGDSWKAPEIEEALKQRLQDSYELYFETIQDMQQAMKKLNDRLRQIATVDSTEPADPAASTSKRRLGRHVWRPLHLPRRLKRFLKKGIAWTREKKRAYTNRTTFVLGQATRKRLFTAVQDCNDKLETLLRISDDTSDLLVQRSSGSLKTSVSVLRLSNTWNGASQLYRALSGSWNCQCLESHSAGLLLRHDNSSSDEFNLGLFNGSSQHTASTQWTHCCVRITGQVAQGTWHVDKNETPQVTFASRNGAAPGKKSILKGPPVNKSETVPRCLLPPPELSRYESDGLVTPRISITLHTPDVEKEQKTEGKISSLCSRLASIKLSISEYAGYLEGDENNYYIYHDPDAALDPVAQPRATLEDLLLDRMPVQVDRRQRYQVALELASSFVQLHGTPWMTELRKAVVEFLTPVQISSRDPHRFKTLVLCVSRGFGKLPPSIDQVPTPDVDEINMLRIMLVELCFGKPIEEYRKRWGLEDPERVMSEEQRKKMHGLNFLAAIEWRRDIVGEAGVDYDLAAEWCLSGSRDYALDAGWRKLMIQRVIVPLERCCSYFDKPIAKENTLVK